MKAASAALLAGAGLLAACADAPLPSEPDLTLRPQLSAVVGGSNQVVPLSFSEFVPCANGGAGESIIGSGDLHVRTHVVLDGRGGVHVIEHHNPQGVTAIGTVSGAVYRGVGVTRTAYNATLGQTTTHVNVYRFIGRGLASNFSVHQNAHVTVHANGTVATTVAHEVIRCD